MNQFQKQLLLGGKCMAELSGPEREGIGQPEPPVKVSVEEFERDRCPNCGSRDRITRYGIEQCEDCGYPV